MLRGFASKLPAKATGKVTKRSTHPFTSNTPFRATSCCGLSSSRMRIPTRSFHNYGDPFPEPEFTPGETIMLDIAAWTVAFAMLYEPARSASAMLQGQGVDEEDEKIDWEDLSDEEKRLRVARNLKRKQAREKEEKEEQCKGREER